MEDAKQNSAVSNAYEYARRGGRAALSCVLAVSLCPVATVAGLPGHAQGLEPAQQQADGSFAPASEEGGAAAGATGVAGDAASADFQQPAANGSSDAMPEGWTDADWRMGEDDNAASQTDARETAAASHDLGDSALASTDDDASASAQEERESTRSVTDINRLWESQAGGTAVALQLADGGTYGLSSDMSASASLVIDAQGQDVVLDLGSFTFTSIAATAIEVVSAKSFTIIGQHSDVAKPQLVQGGAGPSYLVKSAADALFLREVGMLQRSADDAIALSNLGLSAVYATAGKVNMDSCAIEVDLSNQTKRNLDSDGGLKGCPRGVYLGNKVAEAEVRDCEVTVLGSSAAELSEGEAWSTTCCANVYGVYSQAKVVVTVAGGSIRVSAPRGYATGVYGLHMRLESGSEEAPVQVSAAAGKVAAGVCGPAAGAVTLAGGLRFSADGSDDNAIACALLAMKERAFTFEQGFQGEGLTSLVGDPEGAANGEDMVLGSLADAVSADQAARIASALAPATGYPSACSPRLGADGRSVAFVLDETRAPVEVVDAQGTARRCATVADALKRLEAGGMLRLLSDVDGLTFSKGAAGDVFAIDLAGHAITSLVVDSAADVSVASGGARGQLSAGYDGVAVDHKGAGSLTLSGVDVRATSIVAGVAGVRSARGRLVLEDVQITASSTYGFVYGVRAGGELAVEGGSVCADSPARSVPVRAISSSSSADVSVAACKIVSCGMTGVAGIDVGGSLRLSGNGADDPDIKVQVSDSEGTAWGVRVRGEGARAYIDGARIEVSGAEPAASDLRWALASGESGASAQVTWELAGRCSFAGAPLGIAGEPLHVAEGFSLDGASALWSERLDSDACVQLADGVDATAVAGFAAAADSPYEGWELVAAGETGRLLVWRHDAVARNQRSGQEFGSFAEALAAAQRGDTLTLVADAQVLDAVAISRDVVVDLAGHTLTCGVAAEDAVGASAALSVEAGARFTVRDCASEGEKGQLRVRVSNSAGLLSADEVCGVSVASGASFKLEGAQASLEYVASSNADFSVGFTGVRLADGALLVSGGTLTLSAASVLSVSASARGCSGPRSLIGVAAGDGGVVNIDETSSLSATNASARVSSGLLVSPGMGTSVRTRQLMEFFPDEQSDLYREIQEQFALQATLDAEAEPAGFAFGANVYHASPLTLSDGTMVWAYSDPVAASDIGKPQAVRATHFFFQCYEDELPQAVALSLGEGAQATVGGEVSATSPEGESVALQADAGAKVRVFDSASLSAAASHDAFNKKMGIVDVRDVLGLDKLVYPEAVFYPTTVSAARYELAYPSAAGIQAPDGVVSVGLAATISADAVEGAPAAPIAPSLDATQTVSVTFSGTRGADGAIAGDCSVDVPFGATLASQGIELPQAQDYVSATGVRYRFVGWSANMTYRQNAIWDPADLPSACAFNSQVAGAQDGAVTLYAAYVPVASNQVLTMFKVDSFLEACAVDAGDAPSYKLAAAGSRFSTPGKYVSDPAARWGFTGWEDASGQMWCGTLPAASGDVRYTARFAAVPATVNVTIGFWGQVDGTWTYTSTTKALPYGSSPSQAASGIAQQVVAGGVVYELEGFSARRSDTFAPYADAAQLPAATAAATYYGVYTAHEQRVSVTFVLDGEVYARAENVPAGTTIDAALLQYAQAARPSDKADGARFRGWAEVSSPEKVLMSSVKTLGELVEGDGSIELSAVFADKDAPEDPAQPDQGTDTDDGDTPDYVPVKPDEGKRGQQLAASSERNAASASAAATARMVLTRTDVAVVEDAGEDAGGSGASAGDEARAASEQTPSEQAAADDAAAAQAKQDEADSANAVGFFAVVGGLAAAAVALAVAALRNRRADAASDDDDALADDEEIMDF